MGNSRQRIARSGAAYEVAHPAAYPSKEGRAALALRRQILTARSIVAAARWPRGVSGGAQQSPKRPPLTCITTIILLRYDERQGRAKGALPPDDSRVRRAVPSREGRSRRSRGGGHGRRWSHRRRLLR